MYYKTCIHFVLSCTCINVNLKLQVFLKFHTFSIVYRYLTHYSVTLFSAWKQARYDNTLITKN